MCDSLFSSLVDEAYSDWSLLSKERIISEDDFFPSRFDSC